MEILQIEDWDGQSHRIEIEKTEKTKKGEKSLLSILREQHLYIDAPCDGKGECGKCRVQFLEGTPEPTGKEKKLLTEAELSEGIRLACAVKIEKDCRIRLPERGAEEIWTVTEEGISGGTLKRVNETEKETEKEIKNESADYGIAIDLGTTTLVAELVNLKTGQTEAVATSVNHQRAFGADVLSRIQSSCDGKSELLRKSIQRDLCRMMDELQKKAGIRPPDIKKVVIAGNTTMCHLLLGFSCETLGTAPFTPVDISLMKLSGRLVFGETWNELAAKHDKDEDWKEFTPEVTILPGISTFVGADIVAGIYGSGMAEQEETVMLLDIGTNGEMVIGNKEGFLATSAAAGPVFEGGSISCGVPGIPGAVTHVTIQKKKPDSGNGIKEAAVKRYQCSYDTIDKKPPIGFCGTGIIDMVSELVRENLIDENGTLAEPWFETGFPLEEDADATEKYGNPAGKIRISQQDIREIQLAKSAIRAGIETLLMEYGKMPDKVYLAGGFGFTMDVDKAVRIGLFPEHMRNKIIPLGNTSLTGAKHFLLEHEEQAARKVQWIAEHTKEINLAMHPKFNDFYLKYMFFLC